MSNCEILFFSLTPEYMAMWSNTRHFHIYTYIYGSKPIFWSHCQDCTYKKVLGIFYIHRKNISHNVNLYIKVILMPYFTTDKLEYRYTT